VRIAALVLMLLLGGLGASGTWGAMWLLVPAAVAAGLLLAWRFGPAALAFPAGLGVAAVALAMAGARGMPIWSTAWVPLGAAVGTWMGLHEEGGGAGMGERAWMHVPLLALAALLPVTPGFEPAVGRFDLVLRTQQEAMLKAPETAGWPAAWREELQTKLKSPPAARRRELMFLVPNAMFLWAVVLVAAGRALAARAATLLGWPALSRSPLRAWRLPDAALVPLLAGLALVVFADRAWHPGASVLLLFAGLGYSVQGIAVVESVLRTRGLPPAFVKLTLVFVIVVSLLWALPALAVVGLSDVWLDYRRLEPSPDREA
jgi:hypothetical protein